MFKYTRDSYLKYINGDDEGVDALDEQCISEMRQRRDKAEEDVTALEHKVNELELKLEGLKSGPSQEDDVWEVEKVVLDKYVTKFHMMVEQFGGNFVELQKNFSEKCTTLEAKVEEIMKRICEESEELKKKNEEQWINWSNAERMKGELQVVDQDIEETEAVINGWEEKISELDSNISHMFEELEQYLMKCNQAIRRLKLGNGFQYQLNADESTPSEILGLDYKSILKPALTSFSEDIKRSSMKKLDELISLRQQSGGNDAMVEEKRNRIAVPQSHNDEVEAELNVIRKEIRECTSSHAAGVKDLLKTTDAELKGAIMLSEKLVEHTKNMASKISRTRSVPETIDVVANKRHRPS